MTAGPAASRPCRSAIARIRPSRCRRQAARRCAARRQARRPPRQRPSRAAPTPRSFRPRTADAQTSMSDTTSKTVFGRFTCDALPLHEPILLGTFIVVAARPRAARRAHLLPALGLSLERVVHQRRSQEDRHHVRDPRHRHAAARLLRRADDARPAGDRVRRQSRATCRRTTTTRSSPPTASIMIFFVAMPLVTGLMNFVVPLQIGARDVAFPFLNNFSFWMTAAGAVLTMMLAVRRRVRAHRLAGLCAAVRARLQPGRRRRLLSLVAADRRRRHAAVRHQPGRHHRQDARARHDHDEDAGLLLDRAVHQRPDRRRLPGADRRPRPAVARPLRRHELLHQRPRRQRR